MPEQRRGGMIDSIVPNHKVTRRKFLNAAALFAGSAAIACTTDKVAGVLPKTATRASGDIFGAADEGISRIDRIIVVMMENRSFDHFLGWAPQADGRQAGLKFVDNDGISHHSYPLAPDFQGCGKKDPDHSYQGGRIQYDNGACDGFLRGDNDIYAVGYYGRKDLDFYGQAVPDWTIADRYFCSILGPTFPNRFYQHAAQTDRLSNTLVISTLPTIWDRLADAGRVGRYYYSDLPFLGLWGAKYLPIARPVTQFYADCAAGTLPDLAFLDPAFLGEDQGTGSDDHPHNDIRAGESFLNRVYTAVTTSPAWERTLLVINYDEWGGFFDHVPPPMRPITASESSLGNDGRLGFRTPLLLVSPFARSHKVASSVYDHTSILKLVEQRWNLAPLAARDANALSIGTALDFFQDPREAPQYEVAQVTGAACAPSTAAPAASSIRANSLVSTTENEWEPLRDLARSYGWQVP